MVKNTIVESILFSKITEMNGFLDETEKRIVPLSWSNNLVFFLSFSGLLYFFSYLGQIRKLYLNNFNLKEIPIVK